jgi:hypothetical protein
VDPLRGLGSNYWYILTAHQQEMWAVENLRRAFDKLLWLHWKPPKLGMSTMHCAKKEWTLLACCAAAESPFLLNLLAPVLLIAGGGHSGRPLAELARTIGYHVQTVDAQTECGEQTQLVPEAITSHTYAVLITENHIIDEAALRLLLTTPVRYIGMIGSRRKAAAILGHLRSDGYIDELLAQVHTPIGFGWARACRNCLGDSC